VTLSIRHVSPTHQPLCADVCGQGDIYMNIGHERAAGGILLLGEEQSSIGQACAAHWQAPWLEPPRIRPSVTTVSPSTNVALILREIDGSTSDSLFHRSSACQLLWFGRYVQERLLRPGTAKLGSKEFASIILQPFCVIGSHIYSCETLH
jgi:hypothetical protein